MESNEASTMTERRSHGMGGPVRWGTGRTDVSLRTVGMRPWGRGLPSSPLGLRDWSKRDSGRSY